ncbi:MAG: VOC family protein [Actinobacteria bacterium]|nr:VOC family protein [Actinomycetota bacterium]
MAAGEILGLHHVKVPVTDLARSRAWYERVFELEPIMEFPDDDGVVRGVAYQPKNAFALSLRENAKVAQGIAGFDPFAILLQGEADVQAWADRLDSLGVKHSPVIEATIGWILSFHDPDGLELRFYTSIRHGADVSGQAGYGRAAHPSPHAR